MEQAGLGKAGLALKKNKTLVKEKMDLDIIFEDEHLLVINKKSGIVVHPGSGINEGTLVNGLLTVAKTCQGSPMFLFVTEEQFNVSVAHGFFV